MFCWVPRLYIRAGKWTEDDNLERENPEGQPEHAVPGVEAGAVLGHEADHRGYEDPGQCGHHVGHGHQAPREVWGDVTVIGEHSYKKNSIDAVSRILPDGVSPS